MLGPIQFKRYFLALLTVLLMQTPVAHATLIALQPSSKYAATGDSISLDLVISGLGNFGPDSLGAFDISVGYDPSVVGTSAGGCVWSSPIGNVYRACQCCGGLGSRYSIFADSINGWLASTEKTSTHMGPSEVSKDYPII